MLPFDESEYRLRIQRTKEKMREMGLDVFLVFDPANMNYLTGYDGWSFYVPQLVVVARDEEYPLWVGREQDAEGARITTLLPDENIIGYPDHYVHHPDRHPFDFLCHQLKMRELDFREIGVDMDSYYVTPSGFECLHRNLPRATFVNVQVVISALRAVKSEAEIAYMRQAGRIMNRVMEVARDAVRPGVRECDAAGEIRQAQVQGLPGECGGDYPAIEPIILSGQRTAAAHLPWTDKPFEHDTVVILELAACRYRYHAPLARTVYLGNPPGEYLKLADTVIGGLHAALDTLKPGATCEEVEFAWSDYVGRYGVKKTSRIGYSMGLNYPPDWGEHILSLRRGDKTRIEPGMAFHVIPGIWQAGRGIEISESVIVTENGCEPLCQVPRELLVKAA